MTNQVTLEQAMSDAGTGDVGLFGHAVVRVAPGLPNFDDPGVYGEAWDKVKADVKQHVAWHNDSRFTKHALPGGREKITKGPSLNDPCDFTRVSSMEESRPRLS